MTETPRKVAVHSRSKSAYTPGLHSDRSVGTGEIQNRGCSDTYE